MNSTISELITSAWDLSSKNQPEMKLCLDRLFSQMEPDDLNASGHYYCLLALYYARSDHYADGIETAERAMSIFTELKDAVGQVRVLRVFSTLYGQSGKYDACLNACKRGLQIVRDGNLEIYEEDHVPIEFSFLNNIASICTYLGRNEEALDFYHQSEEYIMRAQEGPSTIYFLCNLAEAYVTAGDPDLGLSFIEKALAIVERKNMDVFYFSMCYSRLGFVYWQMGNFSAGKDALLKGLHYAELCQGLYSQSEALLYLGKLFYEEGDLANATAYLERCVHIASNIQSGEHLKEGWLLLSMCAEATKDFDRALSYYKSHVLVLKNAMNLELEQKIESYEAEFRIEQAKKDAEIHKLINVELKEKNQLIADKAAELEASYLNISTLSLIGQEITSSLDIDNVSNTIYESLKKLMDVNIFAIASYDEDSGIIDYHMMIEESQRLPAAQSTINTPGSMAAQCIRTKRALVINDLARYNQPTSSESNIETNGKAPESLIFYPLMLESKVTGVISVQSYRKNAYSNVDINTINILASYIAIALNNSKQSAQLQSAIKELEYTSKTDPLTDLYNRRYMTEKIYEEWHRYRKHAYTFSILITDIDKFKNINDTFGHDCGDVVLKELSTLLKSALRKQDYMARWGGEEFLILLTETDACEAARIAERLRISIAENEFLYYKQPITLTMTFGVAEYDDSFDIDETIKRADRALYEGKSAGRNRTVVWNETESCENPDI